MKAYSVVMALTSLLVIANFAPIYAFRDGVKIEADGKPIHDDIAFLYPFVTDWNNDGKKDLIVGQPNKAKIRLYLNYGTDSEPQFKDFAYLSADGLEISLFSGLCVGAYPQVVDWNNDGKKDLIVLDALGQIWVYLNIGTDDNPELAKGTLAEIDGKPIITTIDQTDDDSKNKPTRDFSSFYISDWDSDGLIDMIVCDERGEFFYKNIGTESSPTFKKPLKMELVTGLIKTPFPYVIDWDSDGKKDLLVGYNSHDGIGVSFLRNIGTTENPQLDRWKSLILVDIEGKVSLGLKLGSDIQPMNLSGIAVTDWNNDGKCDILAGGFYSKDDSSRVYGTVWIFLGE